MSFEKKFAFLSLSSFLGLAQVNAYVAEPLQEATPSQEVIFLVDREGEPRCKVGTEDDSDRLDHFVEHNAEDNAEVVRFIDDELDALRECDLRDVFYLQLVSGEIEIQEAGVANGLRSLIARAVQLFTRKRPSNNILDLAPEQFRQLPNLRVVNLSRNQIEYLNPKRLDQLRRVREAFRYPM